jgi:glucosyl-3-phosphoglycerate phosphatase
MDRYVLGWQTGNAVGQPKTVYLVRHGESTHNAQVYAALGADPNDARYLDAALTARGAAQANALAPRLRELAPQLVVASPLTRAVDTCLRACALLTDPVNPRRIVRPECSERLAYACDIGSSVHVLEKRFPQLDFAHVRPHDAWWWTPDKLDTLSANSSLALLRMSPPGSKAGIEPVEMVTRRVNAFRAWLVAQPETRIVVFGHGAYLRRLMSSQGSSVSSVPWFGNCEIRKILL